MNQALTATPPEDIVVLGGFPITSSSAMEAEQRVRQTLDNNEKLSIFFANTNFVVKCQSLQAQMAKKPTLIVNDGIGLDIASWLIYRKKFPENLAGTDFLPALLHNLNDRARVFLLGAKPGVAVRAARTLESKFDVDVVGTADGYEQARDIDKLISEINMSRANIVFVAMGNPFQEQWILQHQDALQANIFVGVGALLDFLAGDKPRAPQLVRKLRLEWLYRLSLEPTRLMRRYTIDIAVFLTICFRAGKNNVYAKQ